MLSLVSFVQELIPVAKLSASFERHDDDDDDDDNGNNGGGNDVDDDDVDVHLLSHPKHVPTEINSTLFHLNTDVKGHPLTCVFNTPAVCHRN